MIVCKSVTLEVLCSAHAGADTNRPLLLLLYSTLWCLLYSAPPAIYLKIFDFWCLDQLCFTVYYHVDLCVLTWEHGSVNVWHPGVGWNPSTSSRPPANFHTYLSFWAFEPIRGNEDLWIRGTWESSWNHLPLSSGHLPHPTIACWSSVSMLLPPFLLICVSKSVASWTHLPSSTWPPASPWNLPHINFGPL